ncbi:DEAD/DEAH box helicase [Fodinicurvata halophila]|uniref:DEAD/DEAH box helicase n=1 Tax=Fodinicurvata halophila TaxID=1419723 RepID=A0ABV8UMN5_9PROT
MTSFNDLGLNAELLKALSAQNFETPTPIQSRAIPLVLQEKDLLGIAQTGTGKTAAFGLPLLQRLKSQDRRPVPKSCRALILSPTRELAGQIADNLCSYAKFSRQHIACVVGGVPVRKQAIALNKGVDVLVATPGRLLDLVDQRAVQLQDVEVLVLDEADQMLDLGFIHALDRIAKLVPSQRQTLLFSATMPKSIASLAARFLRDPVRVEVSAAATPVERIDQKIAFVQGGGKANLLREILSEAPDARALVFTRTKRGADRVSRDLETAGLQADALHGNKSQSQRERALGAFRKGKARVLVATDIAARGIDVSGITHVINYDLPNVPESYVHRIGRTARAGASGLAISFCSPDEHAYLRDIERLTGSAIQTLDGSARPVINGGGNNARPGGGKSQKSRSNSRGAGSANGGRAENSGKPNGRNGQAQRKRRTDASGNGQRRQRLAS